MAISEGHKNKILSLMSPSFRERYASGELGDAELLRLAEMAGIPDPDAGKQKKAPLDSRPVAQAARPAPAPQGWRERLAGIVGTNEEIQGDLSAAGQRVATSASAGLDRSLGAMQYERYEGADPNYSEFNRRRLAGGFVAGGMLAPQETARESNISARQTAGVTRQQAEQALERDNASERARLAVEAEEGAARFRRGQQKSARAEELGKAITSPGIRAVSEPVADIAGSPSSLLSIPGGAFASIPAMDVYNQEYTKARLAGQTPEDARKYAASMAGTEAAISAVPTGRLGRIVGKRALDTADSRLAKDIIGTAIGEGASEGVTTIAQEGVKAAFERGGDPNLSRFAAAQRSQDLWEDVRRSTVAGAVGGGGIQSVASPIQIAYENGQRVRQLREGDARFAAPLRRNYDKTAQENNTDLQTVYKEQPAAKTVRVYHGGLFSPEEMQGEQFATNNQARAEGYASGAVRGDKEPAVGSVYYIDLPADDPRVAQMYPDEFKETLDLKLTEEESRRLLPLNSGVVDESVAEKVGASDSSIISQSIPATQVETKPKPKKTKMSEQDIRRLALSSVSDTTQTSVGPRAEDVINSVAKRVGSSRSAATIGNLVSSGRLVVVDDASQIPAPDVSSRTDGYYDGERMYIVANNVDPENIDGSLMKVVAHEAKHAADFSNTNRPTLFSDFVGDDANKKLVSQIERANDKYSKEAVAKAKAAATDSEGNLDDVIYRGELPAYYISAAAKDTSGPLPAAARSVVSATRVAAKRLLGIDNVNVKDIAYLSQKLTEDVALNKGGISADVQGMASISGYSPNVVATTENGMTNYESVQDGISLGYVEVSPEGRVISSSVNENARGQGIGRAIYKAAVDKQLAKNMPITSDGSVTQAAARVWESLSSEYDVKKNPTAFYNEEAGAWFTQDGAPVFSIEPDARTVAESVDSLDRDEEVLYLDEDSVSEDDLFLLEDDEANTSEDIKEPRSFVGYASLKDDVQMEVAEALKGRKLNFAKNTVLGQFSGFGVLGKELGEIKELAEGEAASIAYVAEGDYHRLNGAIEVFAETQGISVPEAKARVDKVINIASSMKSPDIKKAYISEFVEKNPELAPLIDALNNIAAMSKRIVAERARDPRPFTDAELKKYSYILNNEYTYFTRTYAAFQGREGKRRNERLYKEWRIAKTMKAKGKTLSAAYDNAYNVYEKAVDFIINNDVAVFDPEMLTHQPIDRINYLYSTWVGDPAILKRRIKKNSTIKGKGEKRKAYRAVAEAAIAEAGKKVDAERIRREAEYLVNGMLGLNEQSNPIISYYRGLKEDTGILKKRQQIPQEIQDLFGEVQDLPTRVAITLAKQGELAARSRMLREIFETGKGKWFVTKEDYTKNPDYSEYTEELSGEQWGPLDGVRMKPYIAAALNDGLDIFTPLSVALAQSHATVDRAAEATGNFLVRATRNAAAFSKYVNIVMSPANIMLNAIGSTVTLAQNVAVNPTDMKRAMQAAFAMVLDQTVPGRVKIGELEWDPLNRNADLEKFLRYGLLDSAVGQELRATPAKMLKDIVLQVNNATTSTKVYEAWHKATKAAGRAKGALTETFALSDAWVKPAVFLGRVRFLERINTAENKGWSQEQIERMAADMTKNTTITFQRAAPIVKLMERLPITQYGPYLQGVFRSMMYSYAQGFKDIVEATNAKTPEGRLLYGMEGAKRIAGALAGSVGVTALTAGLQQIFNSDDDEKKIKAAEKFMYQEARYGHSIYLGKDANKNPVFYNLSRIDPNGPANDILRVVLSDESQEAKLRAIKEHIKDLWIKPRILVDTFNLGTSIFDDRNDTKDKRTKVERIFPTLTTEFKQMLPVQADTSEALVQLIDGFVPGALNALDGDNPRPVAGSDAEEQAIAYILLLTGGRLQSANPDRASFIAGNELEKYQRQGRRQINEALQVQSPEDAADVFFDLRDGEVDRYDRLREVYLAMRQYGYSHAKAVKVMRDNKVQKKDIAAVRGGRPIKATGLISLDSLEKAGEMQDRNLSPEDRKQAERERKKLIKRLRMVIRQEQED